MNVSAKCERRNGLFEWKSENAAVSTGMCLGLLSKSSTGGSSGGNLEGLVAQELWVASTGILGGATMQSICLGYRRDQLLRLVCGQWHTIARSLHFCTA